MSEAIVKVVQESSEWPELEKLLEAEGYGGATAIPIMIPVNSLDEIPTVLANMGEYAEKIGATIISSMEGPDEADRLEAALDANKQLEQENATLKAKLEGVSKALDTNL